MAGGAHIVVVGGGAAGLATAIFARRHNPKAAVVVFDGARKPGAKILVSGGSRCNVTNAVVSERDFWGGSRAVVRRVLRAFPVDDTITFFRELGVRLHQEADGKLFPDTNRARDVLDALLAETSRVGVILRPGARVVAIDHGTGGFLVRTAHGNIHAGGVVLATGGQSLPKTGSDGAGFGIASSLGHTIVPTTPGLAPLVLDPDDPIHRRLTGVAQPAELTIWIDHHATLRLAGSMLWTHFGVSGPVVLDASRHWLRAQQEGRACTVTANFLPGERFEQIDARLSDAAVARPTASVQTVLATMLPASAASTLIDRAGVDPLIEMAHLSRVARRRLGHGLVALPLPIVGSRGYNYAEVTAGGVSLTEIDPSTMESRACDNLYLVGEMLDVDGRIGGFNFQWAWSSGFVAGRAAARHTR